jgi:predicted ATP-grasp superfamily ATP-dependent carboligase
MFLCRKIRQYPPDFGNTSLAEAVSAPEVEQISRRICKQLALVGYVGIEFKRDPRDNAYKILEITPSRIDRQAGLSDACGINIPYLWYAYLLGLNVKAGVSEKPYRWASEVNEVRSLGRYLKRREWTIINWLRSYRNVRRWEVFAGDDLFPFLMLTLDEPSNQIMSRCLSHFSNSG